jgi:hypothetical protein
MSVADFLHPTAPAFPENGKEMECLSCKTKAVYMCKDLRYERG